MSVPEALLRNIRCLSGIVRLNHRIVGLRRFSVGVRQNLACSGFPTPPQTTKKMDSLATKQRDSAMPWGESRERLFFLFWGVRGPRELQGDLKNWEPLLSKGGGAASHPPIVRKERGAELPKEGEGGLVRRGRERQTI